MNIKKDTEQNYYKTYEAWFELSCEFCEGGPLECDCADVDTEFSTIDLDESLNDTGKMFDSINRVGRKNIDNLFTELSLDKESSESWKIVESITMWSQSK